MIGKGSKKGTMRFALTPAGSVKKVELAGSFNDWHPSALKKQKDGSFAATVAIPAGRYEYKFVVDGQWIVDSDNNAWALNPYGTLNSLLVVE
jgi:1,4-alpha-glucan branching enzyme